MYLSQAFYKPFMLKSPFSSLSKSQEKKLTYGLLGSVIITIAILKYFEHFLINEICTNGIISFELSKDLEIATSYMNSWGDVGRNAAGLSLGLDFLFPFLYASFIALLIHKLNERLWSGSSVYGVGCIIIWLQAATILFDLIENFGLIQLLLGNLKPIWVSVAYYFAFTKFLLIFIGFAYIIINFGLFLDTKRT